MRNRRSSRNLLRRRRKFNNPPVNRSDSDPDFGSTERGYVNLYIGLVGALSATFLFFTLESTFLRFASFMVIMAMLFFSVSEYRERNK